MTPTPEPTPLSDEERAIYEWQMWIPGMGEAGQCRLRDATVFVSRVGGLGGVVALELAAAGVGRLVLAHGGSLKPSDLNRQVLQTHDHVGRPRIESIVRRLRELNPRCHVTGIGENASEDNAARLVADADVIVDAAPKFEERLAINRAAFALGKPLVECAVHALDAQITTFLPGRTGCLECQVPAVPPDWNRRFPVFGAVSGTVGCLGAMEVIKLLTGLGEPLADVMLTLDLAAMRVRRVAVSRRPDCAVCSGSDAAEATT